MNRWVEVSFDCLPLRSLKNFQVPPDGSPKFLARCERILAAIQKHGQHNAYYLYNARCKFHLTNDSERGFLEFDFEGTLLTDGSDMRAEVCDFRVELIRETCDWLTAPIVQWFASSVSHAVQVDFNRYIAAGDLQKARERIEKLQSQLEESGGYVGMFL